MATLLERAPENVPGRYYVDATCIACDQCCVMAPSMFVRNPESGLSYVHRQPVAEDEIVLAEEVLDACAVGAVGNDGIPMEAGVARAAS